MADPRLRQITIKSGVLRRLAKEKTVYEREVDQQKARIERLRAEGKDDHVLRKVFTTNDSNHECHYDYLKMLCIFSPSCRKTKYCKNR